MQRLLPVERVIVLLKLDGDTEKGYPAGRGGLGEGVHSRRQAAGVLFAKVPECQGDLYTQIAEDRVEEGEMEQSDGGLRHGIMSYEGSRQWSRIFWI